MVVTDLGGRREPDVTFASDGTASPPCCEECKMPIRIIWEAVWIKEKYYHWSCISKPPAKDGK